MNPSNPRPIVVTTDRGHTVTTEETGKGYKGAQIIGVCFILAGMVSCSAGERGAGIGASLALLGLIVLLAARLGAWWDHG